MIVINIKDIENALNIVDIGNTVYQMWYNDKINDEIVYATLEKIEQYYDSLSNDFIYSIDTDNINMLVNSTIDLRKFNVSFTDYNMATVLIRIRILEEEVSQKLSKPSKPSKEVILKDLTLLKDVLSFNSEVDFMMREGHFRVLVFKFVKLLLGEIINSDYSEIKSELYRLGIDDYLYLRLKDTLEEDLKKEKKNLNYLLINLYEIWNKIINLPNLLSKIT